MLIANWIFNFILFLVGIRLLIWAYAFFIWMKTFYKTDKGIVRFFKNIVRYIVGFTGFAIAAGIAFSIVKPILFQENGTVVIVEGRDVFSQRHVQQFFSPEYEFTHGEEMEIPTPTNDSLVLVNDSEQVFILWKSDISEGQIEQTRMGIVPAFSVMSIPDEIGCIVHGKAIADCIPEQSSEVKSTNHQRI